MYIDIAIIVIVVLFALIGLWKGFFKTLISFCGWLAAFLIAFFVARPVANALLDLGPIGNFVVGTGGKGWSMYGWIYGKLPVLENTTGIWNTILAPFIKIAGGVGGDLRQNVALLIANGVFTIVVFFGLLLLVRLLMLLFTMFANAMTKGKLVGALNRLLGLVIGVVKGAGLVCILMMFMTFIMGLNFSFLNPVRTQLDNSVLGKPVYEQVSKVTDRFITGGEAALRKLLNIFDQDDLPEEPEPDPWLGDYSGKSGSSTYTLELREDGKCKLIITQEGVEGRNEKPGSYSIENDKIYFTYDDETEDSGDYSAEGWILVKGLNMYLAKEGVTPPAIVEYGPIDGTFTLTEGDVTYTITFANGQFSLYNDSTEENKAGVYDADEGKVTLTYNNGDTEEGTYDDNALYLGGKTYQKQTASAGGGESSAE